MNTISIDEFDGPQGYLDLITLIARRAGWTDTVFNRRNTITTQPLPYADSAAHMIHDHIIRDQHITILTDFDMDGVMSGIMAYCGLKLIGARNVHMVIPDYRGPRNVVASDIDRVQKLFPQTSLIITCDVGTTSHEGIDAAHKAGMRIIVTDHHLEDDQPCRADVLVNPNRRDIAYPERDICGAQTIAHVISTYIDNHIPEGVHRNNIKDAFSMLRMFSGIGAMADVMPLFGQTLSDVSRAANLMKIMVGPMPINKYGSFDNELAAETNPSAAIGTSIMYSLTQENSIVSPFTGMATMMQAYVVSKKLRTYDDVNAGFIAWTFAPTINATRRVEGSMADVFGVFLPEVVEANFPGQYHTDRSDYRYQCAMRLIDNNERRKEMTVNAIREIQASDSPYAPYVFTADIPAGIMGLIASQTTKMSNLPAIVIDPHSLSGSARAPQWFSIIDAARDIPGMTAMGHAQACGVRFDDHTAITQWVGLLESIVDTARHAVDTGTTVPNGDSIDQHYAHLLYTAMSTPQEPDVAFIDVPDQWWSHHPEQAYALRNKWDDEWSMLMPTADQLSQVTEQLNQIGPFGHGFEYPSVVVSVITSTCLINTMGSDNQHVKIVTPHNLTLLWWNAADQVETLNSHHTAHFEIELSHNRFSQQRTETGRYIPQAIVRSVSYDDDADDDPNDNADPNLNNSNGDGDATAHDILSKYLEHLATRNTSRNN